MHRRLAIVALALPVALSCSKPPAVDTAAEEKTIHTLGMSFNDLIVAKNDSAIAALYAVEAVMLPPNMPAITGNSAVRTFWAALWPMNAAFTITPTKVQVAQAGDVAIEEGTWIFEVPTPQGAQKDNGKYLVVWRKEGGSWKVTHDMWSSDNPPPAGK